MSAKVCQRFLYFLPTLEAFAKCFAVHLLTFEILKTTWKSRTKNIKTLNIVVKNWKLRVWCSLFNFFHVICKNFDMWTTKHLAQASCTKLALPEDFVIATGHMHSVREFVEKSFAFISKEIVWEGKGKLSAVKCFYLKSTQY